jgi:ribosomal protein L33
MGHGCSCTQTDIQGASKKSGEWYQKTKNKKEDTNKLTILAFKMIPILHNTLLATFIKASGNCQKRSL